jgi:16S rRNA A1518/A1519 N6-dimethyltransferase RsmA/KsgA/DIM1 with predicted DNA glycosylase/AP lyase activity
MDFWQKIKGSREQDNYLESIEKVSPILQAYLSQRKKELTHDLCEMANGLPPEVKARLDDQARGAIAEIEGLLELEQKVRDNAK